MGDKAKYEKLKEEVARVLKSSTYSCQDKLNIIYGIILGGTK